MRPDSSVRLARRSARIAYNPDMLQKLRLLLVTLALVTAAQAAPIFASSAHGAEDYEGDGVFNVLRTDMLGASYWPPGFSEFAFAAEIPLASLVGQQQAQVQFVIGSATQEAPSASWNLNGYSANGSVTLADINQAFGSPVTTFGTAGGGIPTYLDVTGYVNSLIAQGATHVGFHVSHAGGQGNYYLPNSPNSLWLEATPLPEVGLVGLVRWACEL